jgi:hypothetical protein
MKGPHLLLTLLLLAAGAGALLHFNRGLPDTPPAAIESDTLASFLERESGLTFKAPPQTILLPGQELIALLDQSLTRRFGPEGLTHRSKAFALLSLLPPGQDLRGQWITATSAGQLGWFDDHTGIIYLPENFQSNTVAKHATLVRLTARALLHQHQPPPETPLSDDQAAAREAIHGGIAAVLEARFREHQEAGSPLPTQAEIEREAALLSLPLYLHNLVQLPVMQGKDFVEEQLAQEKTLAQILREAPQATSALLKTNAATAPAPALPAVPGLLLQESLGAYASQLLFERLSDYVLAEELGTAWEGDQYLYYQGTEGNNLYWISQWASAEEAAKAAALLRAESTPPAPGQKQIRFRRVILEGATLKFANCADQSTLDAVLPAP